MRNKKYEKSAISQNTKAKRQNDRFPAVDFQNVFYLNCLTEENGKNNLSSL